MKKYLPYLIIFFSFLYIWYIIFHLNHNVFYSGDGGVKFGYIKQIVAGNINTSVDNTFPVWVRDLYNEGYSPFNPPFFYNIDDNIHFSFPIYFPLLSSLMYKIAGSYGLYIIPSLSLLFSWIIMLLYVKKFYNFNYGIIILVTYILATPLFLYGAIFWEHTLAVCLISIGIFYFTSVNHKNDLVGILSGFLFSLSVFFRPEAIVLVVLINISLLLYHKTLKPSICFVLASSVSILLFFIVNYLIYNSILGIHGKQVVEEVSEISYLRKLVGINYLFFRFSPYVLFTIILFIFKILVNRVYSINKDGVLLIVLCIYCLIIPVLLPNIGGKQWGARYMLVLLPVFFMSITWIVEKARSFFLIIVFTFLTAYSIYLNTVIGPQYLIKDYSSRVVPGLEFLKNSNVKIVIVNNDYILQEFYDLSESRIFFKLKDSNNELLFEKIKECGYDKAIVISTDRISSINNQMIFDRKLGDYYFKVINID